ncbi:D-hexose-6-phosphate mutarotase [Parahaliea maris]|uniref:Putative glucose-6-phosphate 1-epimerase n=1 Tax=Parahaliea maris TaxID=2716870 RepID=A0A5C9A294_9GAMM|nr:D-hexose-6-phosphate mutarotase [Parahaliea maris]TXS94124.1 D-hexose-6-phosphate mutarotase [Parahaliea maris]
MRQAVLAMLEALPDGIHEREQQGFKLLLLKAAWGELVVAEQGAQVLHFRPAGQCPLLWLSDNLKPAPAAIRGGIPLCWPWFGDAPSGPAHGVARTGRWQLTVTGERADGCSLRAVPAVDLWPGLDPVVWITADRGALEISLETRNSGGESLEISQALHTYLVVSDVNLVRVQGLEGCEYLDKLRAGARASQAGELRLSGALDRIYDHNTAVEAIDPDWGRRLQIGKAGSGSTVVWNPGAGAADLVDVGMEQQKDFLCIEAANTVLDPVRLAPGECHRLATRISLEEGA